MKKYVFYVILFFPTLLLAQFTGFQDETLSPVYWSSESNYVGSQNNVTSQGINITTEGTVGKNGNVNSGAKGTCRVNEKTFAGYVDFFGCGIRVAVLPFIFLMAVVGFVWGITTMLRNPANEESQKKGREFILWGIIGFFVITSVYALVAIIRRTVGFGFNAKDDATPYIQLKEKVQNLK